MFYPRKNERDLYPNHPAANSLSLHVFCSEFCFEIRKGIKVHSKIFRDCFFDLCISKVCVRAYDLPFLTFELLYVFDTQLEATLQG